MVLGWLDVHSGGFAPAFTLSESQSRELLNSQNKNK
jgi:hypothetical protein